jgi:hypothetical protein
MPPIGGIGAAELDFSQSQNPKWDVNAERNQLN